MEARVVAFVHCTTPKPTQLRNRAKIIVLAQAPVLLLLDEIGYQPLERHDATCLFELVNKHDQML